MEFVDVLLIEDNDGDALLVQEQLEEVAAPPFDEPYRLHRLSRIAELRDWIAASEAPGVVLLDLGLPDSDGVDALHQVQYLLPQVPVIVLTGLADADTTRDALKAGAQDYLIKGKELSGTGLRRAIHHARERKEQLEAVRRSNDELRRFAYSVAHDLKSPMASIIGLLELLRFRGTEVNTEKLDEMLDRAVRAGGRLAEMVDGLLAHAATVGESHDQFTDLNEVGQWVIEVLADRLETTDSVVRISDLPVVAGSEVVLRQAFLNLFGNALKYRADRKLTIDVTATRRGDEWEIIVADNGVGIPQEGREVVFDLGNRVNRQAAGTGVGLAAVRHGVTALGGRVWIDEPASGVGTAVHLVLPAS